MAQELGRVVFSRDRYARSWSLGDRKDPVCRTPILMQLSGDPELETFLSPFSSVTDMNIPSTLTISSKAPLSPPDFSGNSPNFESFIGHVLPPSLEEANAGEPAGSGQLLPVSWQRLSHDKSLLDSNLNPSIIVLVDSVQLASQAGKLVKAIHVLKNKFPGSLLWTPGIGGPDNAAVLNWFGVDIFDLSRSRMCNSAGVILSENGPRMPVESMGEIASIEVQIQHWKQSIASIKSNLKNGTLRSLVDKQSLNSPNLVEHLRVHDKICSQQEGLLSSHVDSEKILDCSSPNTLNDPVVNEWCDFISNQYTAPEGLDNVLILLPCSARKPYRLSKSHGRFIRAINSNSCHEVMVTSPLGLVPRDLEEIWPASHYDIPVTGDWTNDELIRTQTMLDSLLSRHNYNLVINHSSMKLDAGNVELIETRTGLSAGSSDALENLSKTVKEALQRFKVPNRKNNHSLMDTFSSISRKQLKNDKWLEGVSIRGKPPFWRLEKDNLQIAIWSIDRRGFSFSKSAIEILHQNSALSRVFIKSGPKLKGDIFFSNIEAFDSDIKAGNDILVYQDDLPVGLARAVAPAWEWPITGGRLAKTHQRL